MLKKRIKFKDLDGNTVEEDFYFNLNKGELADIELSIPGGLAAYAKIVAADGEKNPKPLMDLFNMLIEKSYGVRGDDGRRFHKSPEIFQAFKETDAYSEFRWWLFMGGAKTIAEFFNAVVGEALGGKTMEELAAKQKEIESKSLDGSPKFVVKDRPQDYSVSELNAMSDDEWAVVSRKFKGQMTQIMIVEGLRRMGVKPPPETNAELADPMPVDKRPLWVREDRRPTMAEMVNMPSHELDEYRNELSKYV